MKLLLIQTKLSSQRCSQVAVTLKASSLPQRNSATGAFELSPIAASLPWAQSNPNPPPLAVRLLL